MEIASHVTDCIEEFSRVTSAVAANGQHMGLESSELADELGRFRNWVDTIAAGSIDCASFEERLRDVPHIRDRTNRLLLDLKACLEDAYSILSGSMQPWNDWPGDTELRPSNHTTEIRQLLADVNEIVTCLNRASAAVQKSSNYVLPFDDTRSPHLTLDLLDLYHVTSRFPGASEELRKRLGRAITRRRLHLENPTIQYFSSNHATEVTSSHKETLSTSGSQPTVLDPRVRVADFGPHAENSASSAADVSKIGDAISLQGDASPVDPFHSAGWPSQAPFECQICLRPVEITNILEWR